MTNTISWSCGACGEFNVGDLTDKAPAALRCDFCFHPLQAIPPIDAAKPRMRLSDEWLGDEIIRPLFGRDPVGRGDGK